MSMAPGGQRPSWRRDLPREAFTGNARRVNNAMWFIALMFAALVGCTVWLSTGGGSQPLPTEPPLTETPR